MVDIESLRTVVATGLREYLGCPVIRTNQNAAPPKYPYVCYTITTLATENRGTYGEYEDGKSRKPVNSIFSFTVQSDDSIESMVLANKAREWLDYVGTLYLDDNDVIVQSVTAITNRDNVLTSEYEYRNGFDCFFYCFDEVERTIEEIEDFAVVIEKPLEIRAKTTVDELVVWVDGNEKADLSAYVEDGVLILTTSEENQHGFAADISNDELIVSQRQVT